MNNPLPEISLITIEIVHAKFYRNLICNDLVRPFFYNMLPLSLLRAEEEIKEVCLNPLKKRMFIIQAPHYTQGEMIPIGYCELYNIELIDATAQCGIAVHPDYHRKKYGQQSLAMLIEKAFHEFNLEKLEADILSFNDPSKQLFSKAGFELEGLRKNKATKNGKRINVTEWGLSR